jgi:deazaflavin-dependent oxidoreductase (nitroreductase family)
VAKTYQLNGGVKLVNRIFDAMTRLGLGKAYRHILTVRGRKSGEPRSTPVDVMRVNGADWLVAGYGPVNWVRNVQAAGELTLSRAGRTRRYTAAPATPEEAVPVLRAYITQVPVTRAYFDATPTSPDEDVLRELPRHAVFRLSEVST